MRTPLHSLDCCTFTNGSPGEIKHTRSVQGSAANPRLPRHNELREAREAVRRDDPSSPSIERPPPCQRQTEDIYPLRCPYRAAIRVT